MDPDTALTALRQAIAGLRNTESESSDSADAVVDRVVDLFDGLDQWLSRGGYPPAPWATRTTVACTDTANVITKRATGMTVNGLCDALEAALTGPAQGQIPSAIWDAARTIGGLDKTLAVEVDTAERCLLGARCDLSARRDLNRLGILQSAGYDLDVTVARRTEAIDAFKTLVRAARVLLPEQAEPADQQAA